MMGMSLVCILILLFQTLAPGCYYSIDERGIFAKRWYLKKLFRFEDIRQIKIISSEQVCSEAEKIHSKEVKYMKTTGFKNAYSSRKKLAEFIQFCTVNIVLRETSQGHHLSNTNYRGRPHGQFVVITLKDGSSRLLTPKDPKNFLVTYRSYFRRAA
jgi:hypothetical protein